MDITRQQSNHNISPGIPSRPKVPGDPLSPGCPGRPISPFGPWGPGGPGGPVLAPIAGGPAIYRGSYMSAHIEYMLFFPAFSMSLIN